MRNLAACFSTGSKPLLFFAFSLLLSTAVMSQVKVSGRVTGPDSKAVFGATVSVKGTNVATTTNTDGGYSIEMPRNSDVLVFSYVGFEVSEVNVRGNNLIDITMKLQTTNLNEVVVTGYTSQRVKDITGSVSVVKVSDLKSVPTASAETQLQGRAAGVNVVQDNTPGEAASVRIRGFASFTGNGPLYVIDGVPSDDLTGINPNDIESMQVLKDAASASVYGSRASNGVIILTTKQGKQGKAKVTYDMYTGIQDPGNGFTNLLNSQEMANLVFLVKNNNPTGGVNTDQYGSGPVLPDYIFAGGASGVHTGDPLADPSKYDLNYGLLGSGGYNPYLIVPANKTGTDWFKEATRNAPINSQNLTVSGANDKNKYLFSLNYFDQKSILQYNYYKRYTARINTEFNVKSNIRIGENFQMFTDQKNTGAGNNGEGTVIAMAYREQPIIPVYTIKQGDFAGSRGSGLGNGKNPLAQLYRAKDNKTFDYKFLGNMYAEVDFLSHFTARTSFGGFYSQYNYYNYPAIEYENAENNVNVTYGEGFGNNKSWTWTNQLTYNNIFLGKHAVNALIGSEAILANGREIDGSRQNYYTYNNLDLFTLNSGSSNQVINGTPYTDDALFSLFGKVDYSYDNKYLASFTIRRDGSSHFGADTRYGVFPAGSVGWRVTQESFANNISWLPDFKLRASYGQMGNQRISGNNQFTLFSSGSSASGYDINGNNSPVIGNFLSFIGNAAGKWETNTSTNVGFDASLFKGNTSVSFDVYEKKTSNLLFNAEQQALAGATASQNPPAFNVGSMKNWGIDLLAAERTMLGGKNGVKLDGTLTFTTYKNKVTSIAPGFTYFDADAGESGRIGGVFTRNEVGHPINSFYGYEVVGLFPTGDLSKFPVEKDAAPGRFMYRDVDGNDTINDNDRTFFGDPNPKFSYGINLSLSYKNFDLTAFFYGVAGKHSINYTRWWTDFFPSFQGGKSKDALYNSWTTDNQNAKVPIEENAGYFSTNTAPNSYYLENSSYFRLKNLQLGYSLPTSVISRVKIDRIRVYVQATNLFTITKYTGLDPEITNFGNDLTSGIDAGVYPAVRQFIFGLSVGF